MIPPLQRSMITSLLHRGASELSQTRERGKHPLPHFLVFSYQDPAITAAASTALHTWLDFTLASSMSTWVESLVRSVLFFTEQEENELYVFLDCGWPWGVEGSSSRKTVLVP